jgi:hypothetical protein
MSWSFVTHKQTSRRLVCGSSPVTPTTIFPDLVSRSFSSWAPRRAQLSIESISSNQPKLLGPTSNPKSKPFRPFREISGRCCHLLPAGATSFVSLRPFTALYDGVLKILSNGPARLRSIVGRITLRERNAKRPNIFAEYWHLNKQVFL